jgi:hypothetical protein
MRPSIIATGADIVLIHRGCRDDGLGAGAGAARVDLTILFVNQGETGAANVIAAQGFNLGADVLPDRTVLQARLVSLGALLDLLVNDHEESLNVVVGERGSIVGSRPSRHFGIPPMWRISAWPAFELLGR